MVFWILLLFVVLLFFYFMGADGEKDWRQELLRAWIVHSVLLVLCLEGLSLFRAVTRAGILLVWMTALIVILLRGNRRIQSGWVKIFERFRLKRDLAVLMPAGVVVLALLVTLIIAREAPPQTWDSLTYHLSRVAHWVQNRSVAHYASGIERQNSMSPGGEFQVLALYVLAGGDQLSTLPAWMAYLGSGIAVSLAAGFLGANRLGQWLAAAFAVTVPMAIVQASSTSTDLTVSFWGMCVVVYIFAFQREKRPSDLVYAAAAAGLSILTKPIIIPYLLPIIIWVILLVLRRMAMRSIIRWGGLAVLTVLLINAGYISRNLATYGQISNPVDFQVHNNQNDTPFGVASVLLKNLGTHAALPGQSWWNLQVYRLIVGLHVKTGLDVNDPRTTAHGEFRMFTNSLAGEDHMVNPYHAYLSLIMVGISFLFARRLDRKIFLYEACVILGMVLFSAFFKWNAFGMRYHLPFFLLLAPVVGAVMGALKPVWAADLVILGLLATSAPVLFSLNERPFVRSEPSEVTIFEESHLDLYFKKAGSRSGYQQITQVILDRGCRQVGLALLGDDPEYLFWVLLGAPRPDLQIEWLISGAPSAKYSRPDFEPCAVICRGCPEDKKVFNELQRGIAVDDFQLFMAP